MPQGRKPIYGEKMTAKLIPLLPSWLERLEKVSAEIEESVGVAPTKLHLIRTAIEGALDRFEKSKDLHWG